MNDMTQELVGQHFSALPPQQVARNAHPLQGGRLEQAAPRSVGAFQLLEDSEQLWLTSPLSALRCDGSLDSRHRRHLVFGALCAYEQLRFEQASTSDPTTVFRRWPACTLVALVAVAAECSEPHVFRSHLSRRVAQAARGAGAADRQPDTATWLRGWREAWHTLVGGLQANETTQQRVAEISGLDVLLAATGVAGPDTRVPELRLNVSTGLPVIAVPGGDHGFWTVRADDKVCPSAADQWIIPFPAVTVECRSLLGGKHSLRIVDPADPMLVFDSDGAVIPHGEPLPSGEVWLLHHGRLLSDAFDGEQRVLEEALTHPGWAGWRLTKVDLTSTRAIRSTADGGTGTLAKAGWRRVLDSPSIEIHFESPIVGVSDSTGRPVYASFPEISLRGADSGSYSVKIFDMPRERLLHWRIVDDGGETTLRGMIPRPVMGTFRVTVEQDNHRAVDVTFTVVEEMKVASTPVLRMFRKNGTLHSACLTVTTSMAHSAIPDHIYLPPGKSGQPLQLRASHGRKPELDLWVEPPHAAVRRRVDSRAENWKVTPLRYSLHELRDEACLELHLPDAIRSAYRQTPDLVAHTQVEGTLQILSGRYLPSPHVIRYNLATLADTVDAHGTVQLWLDLPGQQAKVGEVSIPAPVSRVLVDGARLQLVDPLPGSALRVLVHSFWAPWIAPQTNTLPVGEKDIVLRAPFEHGGPLSIMVLPAEKITPTGWPDPDNLPRGAAVFRVGDPHRIPALSDPTGRSMATYLAGQGPLPTAASALPLLWIAAARAETLSGPALGRATAQECAARLGATPTPSLMTAATIQLTTRDLVETLIRSGIAAHCFRQVADPSRIRPMWATTPLPALLLTSPLLPYLSGSPNWDHDELEQDEEQLLDEMLRWCTPHALDVLTGRGPVSAPADSQPSLLGMRTPILNGGVFAEAGTFHDLTAYLLELHAFVSTSRYTTLFTVLDQRGATENHQDPPVATLSLGFALLARVAAQGDREAGLIEQRVRHVWLDIAARAPDLVAADITLAEFLVNRAHDHEQEPPSV